MRKAFTAMALCLSLGAWNGAQADTLTHSWRFDSIMQKHATSAASAVRAATAEDQMSFDLIAMDEPSLVQFLFTNEGPAASAITGVFFDDGQSPALLGLTGITGTDGVLFSPGGKNSQLPGGGSLTPKFKVQSGFSALAESPRPHNGVNPGEQLSILAKLVDGMTWDGLVSDIQRGDLRIGLHVQAFSDGSSQSLVNRAHFDTPAPSAFVALLGMGAVCATRLVRRRARFLTR